VYVLGDSNKVKQVLFNLVINAAQAGAGSIRFLADEGHRLKVTDNGSGVNGEIINRLFEPFFTTKEKGTGLGLAISYRLLEAMNASINVASPVTEDFEKPGTMFII